MRLESKFSLGDWVYVVERAEVHDRIACPFCGGEGSIEGKDGTTRYCPICLDRKEVWGPTLATHKATGPLCVGRVTVEVTSGGEYEARKETYMLNETGVGSGTVWDVGRLHETREEAEAAVVEAERKEAAPCA